MNASPAHATQPQRKTAQGVENKKPNAHLCVLLRVASCLFGLQRGQKTVAHKKAQRTADPFDRFLDVEVVVPQHVSHKLVCNPSFLLITHKSVHLLQSRIQCRWAYMSRDKRCKQETNLLAQESYLLHHRTGHHHRVHLQVVLVSRQGKRRFTCHVCSDFGCLCGATFWMAENTVSPEKENADIALARPNKRKFLNLAVFPVPSQKCCRYALLLVVRSLQAG